MLLIYQLKVGLCLIAFYLLWKLLLSRETFHRFNRVALLMAMALALVLPLIKITFNNVSPAVQQMIVLDEIVVGNANAAQQSSPLSQWTVMGVIAAVYILGMVVVFVWHWHGKWQLNRLLSQGRVVRCDGGIVLHVLPGDPSPFSYFNHVVIGEKDYHDNPTEILVHEAAHISLKHSWDVGFMSLLTVFQWWNPAAWLMCREMKQIHEYEADQAVLNNGIDARQYQLLLIKKSVGDQLFSMANNFNYQSLKKRIRMMTIKKSSRWKTLRALAVVPVIALALLAFANPEMNTAPVAGQMENTGSEAVPATKAVQVTDDQQTGKDKESRIYKSVEQMPRFPGGEAALMRYLQENIQYPAEAAKNNIQGRVVVQFVVEKDGHIGEVKVVRPVSEELDAEAVRVIKTLPDFEPGRQNGEAVAVWYTVPVSFIVRGDSVKQQTPEK